MKGLQRTAILSIAAAVLACGMIPARAGGPYNSNTAAGLCAGVVGATDVNTCTGHIIGSIVGTLSVNEARTINFGNVAVTGASPFAGDGHVTLNPSGALGMATAGADGLLLLSGANGGGSAGNDGQHPGLYRITGANEGGQTRVYISFATTGGTPLDCNGDSMFPANNVPVLGPGPNNFTVNAFTFTEAGNDVYGHYIVPAGAPAEGTVSGIVFGAVAGLTTADIAVGATLSTSGNAGAYGVGKYEGEFNITASY